MTFAFGGGEGATPLTFAQGATGGFEADVVFFTTVNNRNRAFFQVPDLLLSGSKLEKLLWNFNHELELTGGVYLGNQTKIISLNSRIVDGVFEVYGTVRTEDPIVIEKKDKITGVSIELMVDDDDIIRNENGMYFTQFEWVGTAFLLGIMAGSGDSRVTEIRTFSADGTLTPIKFNNPTIIMNPEEIKTLLAQERAAIKAEFTTELETQLKTFNQIVDESKGQSNSSYEYTDEDGNKYKVDSKSAWESITSLLSTGVADDQVTQIFKAKGLEIKKFEAAPAEDTDPVDPAIADVNADVTKAETFAAKMAGVKQTEDLQNDPAKGAESGATTIHEIKQSFLAKLK